MKTTALQWDRREAPCPVHTARPLRSGSTAACQLDPTAKGTGQARRNRPFR